MCVPQGMDDDPLPTAYFEARKRTEVLWREVEGRAERVPALYGHLRPPCEVGGVERAVKPCRERGRVQAPHEREAQPPVEASVVAHIAVLAEAVVPRGVA